MLSRHEFFDYLLSYWLIARSQKAPKAKQRGIWDEHTTTLLINLRDGSARFGDTDDNVDDAPGYAEEKQCVAYRRAALCALLDEPTHALTRYDIYEGTPFSDNLDWFVTTESYRHWRDEGVIDVSKELTPELLVAMDRSKVAREEKRLPAITVPSALRFAGMVFAGTKDQITRIGVRHCSAMRHGLRLYVGKRPPEEDASDEALLRLATREDRATVLDHPVIPTVAVPPRLTEFFSPKAARVLIAGTGEADEYLQAIGYALGQRLITDTRYVLMTGGLESRGGDGEPIDFSIIKGAREGIKTTHEDPSTRILTILPAHEREGRKRFPDGTTVRVELAGTKARRYAMTLACDVMIGIAGKNTGDLYEMAWVAGKPLLPLPFTGGKAATAWNEYRATTIKRFNLSTDEIEQLEVGRGTADEIARLCLRVIARRLRPRCFLIAGKRLPQPRSYDAILEVLEDRQFDVVCNDDVSVVGLTLASTREALTAAELVLADLSHHPNNTIDDMLTVAYLLGMAHVLGKQVIMTAYTPDGKVPPHIPAHLRSYGIITYRSEQTLRDELRRVIPARDQE